MIKSLIVAIIAIYLVSCSSSVRYSSKVNNSRETKVEKVTTNTSSELGIHREIENQSLGSQIVEYSKNWLGVPYKFGGTNEDGIDCSAFVMKVFKPFGYDLPRTASQQFDFTHIVSQELIKQGDLIFFKRRDKIFHVGIYVGDNQFIHSSTSKGVIIQSLDDNWAKSNLFAFGRIQ